MMMMILQLILELFLVVPIYIVYVLLRTNEGGGVKINRSRVGRKEGSLCYQSTEDRKIEAPFPLNIKQYEESSTPKR
jgi:hypothetical protein